MGRIIFKDQILILKVHMYIDYKLLQFFFNQLCNDTICLGTKSGRYLHKAELVIDINNLFTFL